MGFNKHDKIRANNGKRVTDMLQVMPKKVLIVEDNELNMKLFHDLLEAHGYETLQTQRRRRRRWSWRVSTRPDLILMDIQLPEVSGLEVTKWLKDDDQPVSHSGRCGDGLRDEGR